MTPATTARPRPWVAPVAVGAAGLAGLVTVGVRNPERGFLPCPLYAATGHWCPGCGTTRALHRLLRGDVLGALGTNLLLPVTLTLIGYLWLAWLLPTVGARPLPSLARVPAAVWAVLVGAVVAFGVARNLPVEPLRALAP